MELEILRGVIRGFISSLIRVQFTKLKFNWSYMLELNKVILVLHDGTMILVLDSGMKVEVILPVSIVYQLCTGTN